MYICKNIYIRKRKQGYMRKDVCVFVLLVSAYWSVGASISCMCEVTLYLRRRLQNDRRRRVVPRALRN